MLASLHQNLFDIQNHAWEFGERISAFLSCNSTNFYICQVKITTSFFWWEALPFVFVILFLFLLFFHKMKFSSCSPIQFCYWVTSAANRLQSPVLQMHSFAAISDSKPAQEATAEPVNTARISNTVQRKRRLRKIHEDTKWRLSNLDEYLLVRSSDVLKYTALRISIEIALIPYCFTKNILYPIKKKNREKYYIKITSSRKIKQVYFYSFH